MPPILALLALGCSQSTELFVPLCPSEPLGTVEADEVGEAGLSPADVIAAVDGSVLSVVFEPVHDELEATDAFTDTLEVAASADGVATEERLAGTPPDAPTGPNVPVCPAGPLLTVPVRLTVTAESGLRVELEGRIAAMGPDPSQMWVLGTAVDEVDAPEWLEVLADELAGPDASGTIDFVLTGVHIDPDGTWAQHPASIDLRAGHSGSTLYRSAPAE